MNSPIRQCSKNCGRPAVVIDTGDVALCAPCALPRFKAEASHNIGKQVGTRGPFAKRTSRWR
jgi:hypothetical protein